MNCSYIILREKIPLALKWNSIEAMDSRFFSEASDCWSYGVMAWEILTYGEFPYQGVPMEDVQSMVRAGLRLVQPQNCPDEVRICCLRTCLPATSKVAYTGVACRRAMHCGPVVYLVD